MSKPIPFELDGRPVEAGPGESIWQVAKRLGSEIPHLCHSTRATYRADGNCRACMVEIEGERVLAASCVRQPSPGMKVRSASARAKEARRLVFELLLADQPARDGAHDPGSHFWRQAVEVGAAASRFPARTTAPPAADLSHPAMAVRLDACIHCGLCARACREVQVNDVIGMAGRGADCRIVFDLADPMGLSSCVGCGECVAACPTGALLEAQGRAEAERQVDSVCPYCGVGCQITYHVREGEIVRVDGKEGPANLGRLCVKGRFGFDYVTHPHRLTRPLIRRAGIPRGRIDDLDPGNPLTHFREASWEEALDLAASGLRRIRDRDGPRALAGFGSAKGSNEEAYLFQKLVRLGFGSNNVDHCTRLCHASSVAALFETIGSGAVTAPFSEALNAELIFVIGANPTVNHPVAATFFKNAVKRGAKLVVCDPRGQALSRHATWMLRNRPGSDVALLNSLMHVVVSEGLEDRNYIAGFTEGYAALRAHLEGFAPEAMASITGIAAETVREVARAFAGARAAMIFWGMGISQHVHGTDNARSLISLALLCGQVGRPGTGLHPLRGQNNVQGASDAGLIPMFLPDYKPVGDDAARARMERLWGGRLDPERGLTVVEITEAIHAGQVKGLYVMGENPAMSDPNLEHAREALARLEHLVVQDLFVTETAAYADVILPASAWPEKSGTVTNTDRRVQLGRAALDPPGEARQDLWIIQELARRIGLDWNHAGPADVFAEMREAMDSIRGISWARLEREGAVTYPVAREDEPGREVIFGEGFPTPGGRGRFVPASIVPPAERPDEAYPFVLTTGRILEHWHTGAMTRRAATLDRLEPEPRAFLAPADMSRLAIRPGERVRVATRRGQIELAVEADRNVSSGMISMPFCYAEAAANLLTNDALDPFGKIPEFKYCAARIEKVG